MSFTAMVQIGPGVIYSHGTERTWCHLQPWYREDLVSFTAMVQRGPGVIYSHGTERTWRHGKERVGSDVIHGTAGLSQSWNSGSFTIMEQCVIQSHGTVCLSLQSWNRDDLESPLPPRGNNSVGER